VHFFAVTVRLRRFISRFKEDVNTTNFPFLFLDLCAFPEKSAPGKFAYICISANWSKRDKVSKTLIHFKSDAFAAVADAKAFSLVHLTIIPRAPMGSESIAHEGERNNCFSKIHIVGQKYRDKTTSASKTRFSRHCFGF